MKTATISIEIDGRLAPVGTISGSSEKDYRFQYSREYLLRPGSRAISVNLPVQEEPFSPERTKAYFDGLLPEGFTRRAVARWMHEEEADYLSILARLGRECLGAVQVFPGDMESDPIQPSYQKLSLEEVKKLAAEGAMMSAELVTKAHLSLTGASGKVGLYYDPEEDCWYLPRGTAPSTHIVKQSHVRLDGLVANEQLSQLTASALGIEVPRSFIINTGEGHDGEVLLATERYDRRIEDCPDLLDRLKVPYRLHQEDFAQALGIPASDKYEKSCRGSDGYLAGMFALLRKVSQNPVEDQLKLWDRIVFCYLLGNTDSHLKNFSLLYGKGLQTVRLAPAYDMVCTAAYESATHDMAFYIGSDLSLEEISRDSFSEAAEQCRMRPVIARKRIDREMSLFEGALNEACRRLADAGIPNAEEMKERILAGGGYRRLL